MEIPYIVEPAPLIIFILAYSDQKDMDFIFFSHIGAHVIQLIRWQNFQIKWWVSVSVKYRFIYVFQSS